MQIMQGAFILIRGAQITMDLGTMVFDWDLLVTQNQYNNPFEIHANCILGSDISLTKPMG